MEHVYDYEQMYTLTDELLAILMEANFNTEALSLFIEKVNSSKQFFRGLAADAFRQAAKEAIMNFSADDMKTVLKLIQVAQMPRNNAEAMKITDKIIANKVKNVLKKK